MAIKLKQKTGYSEESYQQIFGNTSPIFLKGSSGFESRNKFVDGKRTLEIDKIVGEFYFPNIGVATVKFSPNLDLPNVADMQKVNLIGAQAIVIKNDVYVKAENIEAVI